MWVKNHVGETSVSQKHTVGKPLAERHMGETVFFFKKAMAQLGATPGIAYRCTNSTAALAFVPPFSGSVNAGGGGQMFVAAGIGLRLCRNKKNALFVATKKSFGFGAFAGKKMGKFQT